MCKKCAVLMVGAVAAAMSANADLQWEGNRLVNLDMASLSSLTNGETVSAWANSGDLGGTFVPAVSGQGAVYQTSVGGAAAVTFAASTNSVMTNTVLPPSQILGSGVWSAEIWVRNPTLEATEDQLSWTDRGNWTSGAEGKCMEIRYCGDLYNGVEHYGGTYNIPWNGNGYGIPLAGVWHHVAITRAADGTEKLYSDGVLFTTKVLTTLDLRDDDAPFALGGVKESGSWTMLFSGSLGRVRVYDGTLTDAQVLNNYQFERAGFQSVWTGASGTPLPWSDSANWASGNVGVDNGTVWIDNGGIAVLTNSVSLNHLYPAAGGLVVSNGATLALQGKSSVYLGNGSAFALTVADGRFNIPGNGAIGLFMADSGGSATVAVGGSGASAVLDVDQDMVLANGSGGTGTMTVGTGGGVYNSNGWFYAANSVGATGRVTVAGGTIGFRRTGMNFVVDVNGGYGEVTVNSGSIAATGDFEWSQGTASDNAYGAVYLNGGSVQAKRFYAVNAAGTKLVYLNGGTVKAVDSRADFLFNLSGAYVQANGAKFDVPSGVDVTAAQPLLADPGSAGGGLTKSGDGRLTLSGTNTFTGAIDVQGGDLFFSNGVGLVSGYSSAITVANEGVIGYATAGGATQLLTQLGTSSSGYLTLFAENSADTVNFSSFPNMKLAFLGVTSYTGTFTAYQGKYTFEVEGSNVTFGASMTDADAGTIPGHLKILGVSGGGMTLTGSSTFTGGAEIDGATVSLGHANALGVQTNTSVPDVVLRNGAVLRFDADMDINAFVTQRLTTDSSGILLIGAANAGKNLDLSTHPGIVVGSGEYTLTYTGTLTPAANTYRLGGGNTAYAGTPYHGLSLSNLTDVGGATAAVIGTPGIVELKAGNTFSGGTVVTNRGVLFLASDGLGAVPGSFDADNLYVNNGVVRSGDANFELDANRGVTVGPSGMELHPWGAHSMVVNGNLSGTGPITTTDGGTVRFGGEGNSYNGPVSIGGGCNVGIGNGANFSWGSTGGIADSGTLHLMTDGISTFSDTVSGSGVVRKEGAGTLTLNAPENYSGTTYIDAGLLRLAATNVLPRGSGNGIVEIASGAALDANDGDLLVGGLTGNGTVTNTTVSAVAAYVGDTGNTNTFGGTVDANVTLVKIGAGKQTLTNTNGAAAYAEARAGTLELFGKAAVTEAVNVADGGNLLVTYGMQGLVGEYFNLSSVPLAANFASLEALNTFLSGKTPALVSNSTGFGATLDSGTGGQYFPGVYGNSATEWFAVRLTGKFFAETTGSYIFATASDDGSMVFIDGEVAVNNNGDQGYSVDDRINTRSSVFLTAGLHEIVIAMYENGGGQGLTVWVTLPGAASDQALPNTLLFSGVTDGSASVGSLTGSANGVVSFGSYGPAALRITGSGDTTFAGKIQGSNTNSRLVKEGAGTLALSSGTSDYFGTLDVQNGNLLLTNGAAILGTLVMADGARTEVVGRKGLDMLFYNRDTADADYSEFQTYALWTAYLSSTFPSGPSYVTNSLMLGTTLDTGVNGEYWPAPYVQGASGTGTHSDNFDTYFVGSIYLDRAGTYTFGTGSDDGSMVFIDGAVVVNSAYDQGVTYRYGTVTLAAGFHSIGIPYRENGGGNAIRAFIAYPGGTTNLLPQSILFSGAGLRGLAGAAGSTLDLGSESALVLEQSTATTHAGTIVGGASSFIQKNGTGTLTLTDDNAAFAGQYIISSGAVRVGNGGTTGALGPTASANIGPAGTLVFDRAGTVTVGGLLIGTGLIRLDGPGEVYVTSASSFAGTVQVNSGRLTFAPGATLGSNSAITNTATVEVETTGMRLQSGIMGSLTGNGTLEVSGTGTLALNKDNSYTGVTRVDSGATLRVSGANQLGGGGDVSLDGGTLAILPDVEQGTNDLAAALGSGAWTLNGSSGWTTRNSSTWVQLCPNTASQAGSAYCNTKINPDNPWYASFRYEVGDYMAGNPADGATFVLQNSSVTALGPSGGELGIKGVSPSIGIFFNLYRNDAYLHETVGWIVNGERVDTVSALNGISLVDGVDVVVTYDGLLMSVTLTQGEKTYTSTRAVDLGDFFGGSTAYVGFTGTTGGATAQQFVGEFSLKDMLVNALDFDNTVVVDNGLTGALAPTVLNDGTSFGFEGLELGSGATLNVSAAAGSKDNTDYTVAVSNVTVAAGIGTVNLAANGSGNGVLGLDTLVIGSGAKLVVTGAVSVPGGVLTVVVPTPVPRGVTQLADFTGATWVGAMPTIVLKDALGNIIDETVVLHFGRLYINTIQGTLIFFK